MFLYTNNTLAEKELLKSVLLTRTTNNNKELPWDRFNQGCERSLQ